MTTNLTAPVQPSDAFYAIELLLMNAPNGGPVQNRSRVLGDPAFDVNRRPKAWAGSGTFAFYDGPGSFKTETVPPTEDSVNLTGEPTFPPYVVVPTGALLNPGSGTINPLDLSNIADAIALMRSLGVPGLPVDQGQNQVTYPPEENRRMWTFMHASIVVNVGRLLEAQHGPNSINGGGVGNPGRFDPNTLAWVPTAIAEGPTDPTGPLAQPWGLPYRLLLPNEQLVVDVPGIVPTYKIERTDIAQAATPGTGAGLSAADEAKLDKIETELKDIEKGLGITPTA